MIRVRKKIFDTTAIEARLSGRAVQPSRHTDSTSPSPLGLTMVKTTKGRRQLLGEFQEMFDCQLICSRYGEITQAYESESQNLNSTEFGVIWKLMFELILNG
jgi:hypothetical protein